MYLRCPSSNSLVPCLVAFILTCGSAAVGLTQKVQAADDAAERLSGSKWALVICGIPGDEEHHKLFSETIESLHESLMKQLGFTDANIRIQFGADAIEEDGPAVSAARGKATRSELTAEIESLRKELQPTDALWVFVLGHAHYDGSKSYLNLPGAGSGESDIHQDDFGKLFQDLSAAQQVFFVTTPVSGFFTRPLSAKGRVVVTATEADREVNETLFHAALMETLADPPAKKDFDIDGDGKISLFDLYINITQNVARRYGAENLLSTEHGQLDDNGDGRGTELQLDYLTEEEGGRATEDSKAPKIRPNSDGYLAKQIVLPIVFPEPVPAEPTDTPEPPPEE
ncbi:MAG: hypothetical protein H8E66_20295 [Planctomycetes bacterium]|nr:hypothetical protein [Planctomycetota bacterium]MBL7044744.1 hypothetical protein [Pirellulaceae bacterium]